MLIASSRGYASCSFKTGLDLIVARNVLHRQEGVVVHILTRHRIDEESAQRVQALLHQGVLPALRPATLLLVGGKRDWLESAYREAVPEGMLTWWPVESGPDATALFAALAGAQSDRVRFDLAIVVGLLEQTNRHTAQTVLSRLRDLYARRLLVRVDVTGAHAQGWSEVDLLAMGLYRMGEAEPGTGSGPGSGAAPGDAAALLTYVFDLYDYKPTPDWLNSRFWAHPERFDKDWW